MKRIRMFLGAAALGLVLTNQTSLARTEESCEDLLTSQADLIKLLTKMKTAETSKIDINDEQLELDASTLGPEGQEILERLDQLMVGHRDVKIALARAAQRAATGTKDPRRPVGTFLLLGVTGTGKSLTAEALAQAINGSPDAKITIDCGEIQHDHEIAKITGSPAGYIGHDSTPPLITTKKLKELTSSKYKVNVLLVDELEKASPALQRLLLGILEKARMTTGTNEEIDFSSTIVIMTSNLGQSEMQRILNHNGVSLGFVPAGIDSSEGTVEQKLDDAARAAVALQLAPEFRNRIDKTFVFKQHTRDEALQVLNMALANTQRKNFLVDKKDQILFQLTDEARDYILKNEYQPEFGGRSLRRTVDHLIAEPLTNLLAAKKLSNGDVVSITVAETGDRLVFRKVAGSLSPDEIRDLYRRLYGKDALDIVHTPVAKPAEPPRLTHQPPHPRDFDPFLGEDFID